MAPLRAEASHHALLVAEQLIRLPLITKHRSWLVQVGVLAFFFLSLLPYLYSQAKASGVGMML